MLRNIFKQTNISKFLQVIIGGTADHPSDFFYYKLVTGDPYHQDEISCPHLSKSANINKIRIDIGIGATNITLKRCFNRSHPDRC